MAYSKIAIFTLVAFLLGSLTAQSPAPAPAIQPPSSVNLIPTPSPELNPPTSAPASTKALPSPVSYPVTVKSPPSPSAAGVPLPSIAMTPSDVPAPAPNAAGLNGLSIGSVALGFFAVALFA